MSDDTDRSISRRGVLKTAGAALGGALGLGGLGGATRTASAAPEKTQLEFAIWVTKDAFAEYETLQADAGASDPEIAVYNQMTELAARLESHYATLARATDGLDEVYVYAPTDFINTYDFDGWASGKTSSCGSGEPHRDCTDDLLRFMDYAMQDRFDDWQNDPFGQTFRPAVDGNIFLGEDWNESANLSGQVLRDVSGADMSGSPYEFPVCYKTNVTKGDGALLNLWDDTNWASNVDGTVPRNINNDGVFEDFDGDDDIDSDDAFELSTIVQGGGIEGVHNTTFDVNKDGELNDSDVVWMFNSTNRQGINNYAGKGIPLYGEVDGLTPFLLIAHELGHCIKLNHEDGDASYDDAGIGHRSTMLFGYWESLEGQENRFNETIPQVNGTFANFDGSDVDDIERGAYLNDDIIEQADDGRLYEFINDDGEGITKTADAYIYGVNLTPPSWYTETVYA